MKFVTYKYNYIFIIFWLLLVIETTSNFHSNNQFKTFSDENVKRVNDKHGLKQLCCGQTDKFNGHQINNNPKVIIL